MRRVILCIWIALGWTSQAFAQSVPNQNLEYAKLKYTIAATVYKVNLHCKASRDMGVNDVTEASTKFAMQEYETLLTEMGQDGHVSDVNQNVTNVIGSVPCSQINRNPEFRNYVTQSSALINDVLFAVSLSEVSECGDVDQNSLTKLMQESNRIAAGMSQRPDYNLVKPLAEKNGEQFRTLCTDGMFAGNISFLLNDPFSDVVLKMVKALNL